MRDQPTARPRYAPTVSAVAIVLAVLGGGAAIAGNGGADERRGNGIPNGSISLKEVDFPIYGYGTNEVAPVTGSADFTRAWERDLPRERTHGFLTAGAIVSLTNPAEAPASAVIRWIFDGEEHKLRTVEVPAATTHSVSFLTGARLSGDRDRHSLALEVAGPGITFETPSISLQGLPAEPKERGDA